MPQAEGDGAVQAWIDLLPEWQTAHARRVDAVVTRQAPNVHKAIKWHGAWYNHEEGDNHQGVPTDLAMNGNTLTGRYLSHRRGTR